MVLGGAATAKEGRKNRSGSKGAKLSKAEREARRAARLQAAKASFSVELEPALVSRLRELTTAGRIEEAEKAAHASSSPGVAVGEILRAIGEETGASFRAATAAHVGRRFAARCPEAAGVLASMLVPEEVGKGSYECAAVSQ